MRWASNIKGGCSGFMYLTLAIISLASPQGGTESNIDSAHSVTSMVRFSLMAGSNSHADSVAPFGSVDLRVTSPSNITSFKSRTIHSKQHKRTSTWNG